MLGGLCCSVLVLVLVLVLKVPARIENCLLVSNAIMGCSMRSQKTALIFEDEDDYETHPKRSPMDYSRTSTRQTPSGELALAPGDRTLPVEHRGPGRAKLMKDGW
jgi:hypothetical protein